MSHIFSLFSCSKNKNGRENNSNLNDDFDDVHEERDFGESQENTNEKKEGKKRGKPGVYRKLPSDVVDREEFTNSILDTFRINDICEYVEQRLKIGAEYVFEKEVTQQGQYSMKVKFEYQGKSGNMYKFKAIPGGWSRSLSAVQLLSNLLPEDLKGKQKTNEGYPETRALMQYQRGRDTQQLLRCPICDKHATMQVIKSIQNIYVVTCGNCNISTRKFRDYTRAIKEWNKIAREWK